MHPVKKESAITAKALPLWRSAADRGFRRAEKNLSMLAWPDGGQRLCRDVDANNAAGGPGKSGECWRASTEDKGSARKSTPTMTPAGRENPENVGVTRRKIKALRGGRRQQCRRRAEKNLSMLA